MAEADSNRSLSPSNTLVRDTAPAESNTVRLAALVSAMSTAVRRIDELGAEIMRLQDAKRRALEVADTRSKENVVLRAEIARLRGSTAA